MITIGHIQRFMDDRTAAEQKKIDTNKEKFDLGFNVFSLMSDLYHRENFHSDIIAALLDANGKHGAGNIYLLKFISFLKGFNRQLKESFYDQEVSIGKEKGRRDITIYGAKRHVILIENKINDAGDTLNQIPTYVADLEKQDYRIDAIVYLTLNQTKEPNEDSWIVDDEKRKDIKGKLIAVRAFDGTPNDFCSGWLQECIDASLDIDHSVILRHYLKVLQYLTRHHMDFDFFEKFNQHLNEHPENAEIAIGIRDSLGQFPGYILNRLFQHFKVDNRCYPFAGIRELDANLYYLYDYKISGYSFNMDIAIGDLTHCALAFSLQGGAVKYQKACPEKVLEIIGMLNDFEWSDNGRFYHYIQGPFVDFEQKTIAFLSDFLKLLDTNKKRIEDGLSMMKRG